MKYAISVRSKAMDVGFNANVNFAASGYINIATNIYKQKIFSRAIANNVIFVHFVEK